jgi:hypothetical protein
MPKSWLLLLPIAAISGAALADPPPARRTQVQARAEQTFAKADTNHDGWLTRDEYHAAITAVARRYDPKVPTAGKGMAAADAQFDAIDTAHAGRISRAAFIAAALARFDSADLNHDGVTTADEARKAAKIREQQLQQQQQAAPPQPAPGNQQ